MKAKIIVLVLTVALMLSLSISASAIVADISSDGEFVTVNVECDTDYSGEDVFVIIIPPTYNISELPETSSLEAKTVLKNIVNYIGKETVGSDGNISFTYNPGDVSGVYTLRLTGADAVDVYEKEFTFTSVNSVHALLNDLKECGNDNVNGKAFVEALFNPSENADLLAGFEILGLNKAGLYPYFKDDNYCNAAARQKIFAEIWQKIPEITSGITENIEADKEAGAIDESLSKLADAFNDVTLINCFFSISEGKYMGEFADKFEEELGLSSNNIYKNVYKNEDICTEQTKIDALDIIGKADYSSLALAEIPEAFGKNVILGVFNGTQAYSVMDLIVEAIPDELTANGIDVAKYKALKYPLEACRKLIKLKPFGTLDELTEDFNLAISEQKKDETEKKTTGGGSSISGGRGSSSYIPSQETSYVSTVPESEMNTDVFIDISGVAWAKESIEALAEKGIITGKGNKVFAPNDLVTREEFTTMMVRAMDAYDDTATAEFSDCKSGDWYYKYVASAVKSGLMNGYGSKFGVGEDITRQDAATVIWRALGITESENTEDMTVFSDENEIADYAKTAVNELRHAGIISGITETEFAPRESLTRAQAAKLIYGMLQYKEVK